MRARRTSRHYLGRVAHQQVLLYAAHKHSVLVVLQAMDAGGKDGTIGTCQRRQSARRRRRQLQAAAPQEELAHDFLWRIHTQRRRGEIVIFNRSHYEDVLVVRVHKLVSENLRPPLSADPRFREAARRIGTTIVKFFLHISKEEQLNRFAQRLDDPARNWKISEADYPERELWDDYIDAYEDAIGATST